MQNSTVVAQVEKHFISTIEDTPLKLSIAFGPRTNTNTCDEKILTISPKGIVHTSYMRNLRADREILKTLIDRTRLNGLKRRQMWHS